MTVIWKSDEIKKIVDYENSLLFTKTALKKYDEKYILEIIRSIYDKKNVAAVKVIAINDQHIIAHIDLINHSKEVLKFFLDENGAKKIEKIINTLSFIKDSLIRCPEKATPLRSKIAPAIKYERSEDLSLAQFIMRFSDKREILSKVAKDLAQQLMAIHSHSFAESGPLDENLTVFKKTNTISPIQYIEFCLKRGHTGKWLGENYRDKLWNYVSRPEVQEVMSFIHKSPSLIHGNLRFSNIFVNHKIFCIESIEEWENVSSGSPLLDICQLFRFDTPPIFKDAFFQHYENEKTITFFERDSWEDDLKILDLINYCAILNTKVKKEIYITHLKKLIR